MFVAIDKMFCLFIFFCGCPSEEKENEDCGSETPARQTQAGPDA